MASSRDDRERLINAFAGEFLVPSADVPALWKDVENTEIPSVREALIRISCDYRVSWPAVVSQARRMELVDSPTAGCLKDRVPARGDLLAVTGTEPVPDLEPGATGSAWRRAVLAAWRAGVVTAARTVELLYGALAEDELPERPDVKDGPTSAPRTP